jgi:hypothetical protein
MTTTRIFIKEYLREYCIGRFNHGEDAPILFPDKLDIYHVILDLTETRPTNATTDGNMDIFIPSPSHGKNPKIYNYLSSRAQAIIERKISIMMWADLHGDLESGKQILGLQYNEIIYKFMNRYGITSITEDAMSKHFYRYKENIRKRTVRRKYNRSNC